MHILATEIQHGPRLILKVKINDTSSGLETCTTDQLFYTSSRRTHPIDCIFLDCRMPSLSGYETAKLIRDGQAGKNKANVFISAMTVQISNTARQECFDSGMNYFIPKPVSKRSFDTAIKASRNKSDRPVPLFKK